MRTKVGDTVPENKAKKQKSVGEETQVQTGLITTHFKPTNKLKAK